MNIFNHRLLPMAKVRGGLIMIGVHHGHDKPEDYGYVLISLERFSTRTNLSPNGFKG